MKINNRNAFITDFILIVFCFLSSGLISLYLGQDGNWDLRNYHFYNAYAFLNDRLMYDIAPAQRQTFHNPLLDVPLYLLMTHVKPLVYGFIIGGIHGITIWLIYKITYIVLQDTDGVKRHLISLAAAITGYYGAANIGEVGTSYHDNLTSIFVLGSLLLIVSSMRINESGQLDIPQKKIFIAGILTGAATGLKLTVAVYTIPFVLALLCLNYSWKMKILNVCIATLGITIGIVSTLSYWMAVLWENFNNPLFPYYNNIFQSPYHMPVNFTDQRFMPKDKFQVLFYPFNFLKDSGLVSEVSFMDVRFAACYLILLLFIFVIFYKWIAKRYGGQELFVGHEKHGLFSNLSAYITVFFILSYIIWQNMFSIYRYIIPLELLSPVFIIVLIRHIFPFNKVFIRVSLAVFAFIVLTVSPMEFKRVAWADNYFGVRVPSFDNLAYSTVIIAGDLPLSYIIPFFPEKTRFIGVKNNLIKLSENTLLHEAVRNRLEQTDSAIYLLYKENNYRIDYKNVMESYGFEMKMQDAEKLYTRFDRDLYLIPLSRIRY